MRLHGGEGATRHVEELARRERPLEGDEARDAAEERRTIAPRVELLRPQLEFRPVYRYEVYKYTGQINPRYLLSSITNKISHLKTRRA